MRQTNASGTCSKAVLDVFQKMDTVLGVIFFGKAAKAEVPAEVQALLDARAAARAAKNWAESDRLRDAIAAAGWLVKDSKDGQTVTRMRSFFATKNTKITKEQESIRALRLCVLCVLCG